MKIRTEFSITMQARMLYLSIFSMLLLHGCGSVYLKSTYYKMEPVFCNDSSKPNAIFTFWETDDVDFPYRRLGLIEVVGKPYSSFSDLHDNLLLQARKACANALIHVYEEPIYVWNKETQQYQKGFKLVGIAVQVNADANFVAKYKDKRYTDFAQRLATEQAQLNGSVFVGIVASVAILFIVVATVLGNPDTEDEDI
jgi:hypothetical protein